MECLKGKGSTRNTLSVRKGLYGLERTSFRKRITMKTDLTRKRGTIDRSRIRGEFGVLKGPDRGENKGRTEYVGRWLYDWMVL